ncbi:hypothetical protein Q7P37_002911 [Cladosporium fusiforme]
MATSNNSSGMVRKIRVTSTAYDTDVPKDLPFQTEIVASCDFPITLPASGERIIKSLSVLDGSDVTQATGGLKATLDISHGAIGWSWAELLRLYTQADLVTFAWVDECTDPSVQGVTKRAGLCLCDLRTHRDCDADPRMSWRETSTDFQRSSTIRTLLDFTGNVPRMEEHFDMALMVSQNDGFHTISLYFDAGKINASFAESVAATLQGILQREEVDARTEIYHPPEITETDKSWIRKHNTEPLTELRSSLVCMFKKQARQGPENDAVCSWDARYSFAELDRLTDNLAHHFISLGLEPGAFVPVMMEKSALIPVALLAISKAGGAFVPMNPDTPAGRVASILEDTKAEIFVCSDLEASTVCEVGRAPLILTHGSLDSIPSIDGGTLPDVLPHQPLACLFTSGSTGHPKGVVLSHEAVMTNFMEVAAALGSAGRRQIQCSPMAFDLAMMQIFLPIVNGGCVCVPHEDEYKPDLAGAINRMSVDTIMTVSSYAALIAPESVPNVNTILVGGEQLNPEVVHKWWNKARLINVYGPSEACPMCTIHTCNPWDTRLGCVGPTLSCHRAIIVCPDDYNKLVPVGAVGHLLLGGICLADRYLNRPEKTQAAFIESPAWALELGLQERRFFCTGDLARYDTTTMDSALTIIGRRDTQVKLRGQRIELGEIEYHLQQLPGVESAMATVVKSGRYADQLVAILGLGPMKLGNGPVRPIKTSHLTLSMMKEHLRLQLPEFMIPTVLLPVKDMIFTGTFKLDRKKMTTWLEDAIFQCSNAPMQEFETLGESETTGIIVAEHVVKMCHKRGNAFQSSLEGRNFTLDEAGLDSIQLIATSIFVRSTFGVSLPKYLIFGSKTTVRSLARFIDSSKKDIVGPQVEPKLNMLQEINDLIHLLNKQQALNSLEPQVFPRVEQVSTPCVFLTGATGFLGSEILHQLMLKPGVRVIALIRSGSSTSARTRLVEAALKAKWWREEYGGRIEVWQGDLSSPGLALAPDQMQRLNGKCTPMDRISVIIHNGAVVHYGHDYAKLKQANVMSTMELLQMQQSNACFGNHQRLVFVSGGHQLSFGEENDAINIAEVQKTDTGYAESKLVAELLVKSQALQMATTAPAGICIVKPGYIVGTTDGRVRPVRTDFIWRYLAACVSLQAISEEHLDNWIFIADVSKIADMVITRALKDEQPDHAERDPVSLTTKLLCGMSVRSLMQILTEDFGFLLRPMSSRNWLGLLKQSVEDEGELHPLFPLMDHFVEGFQIFQSNSGNSNAGSTVDMATVRVVRANIQALISMGVLVQ